ncbi:hypothetical protein Busp01_06010 [Trinickia caryophylli]|nr:hypothetical protein Busp01_06010 [Trinickia caryophylli]
MFPAWLHEKAADANRMGGFFVVWAQLSGATFGYPWAEGSAPILQAPIDFEGFQHDLRKHPTMAGSSFFGEFE